MRSAALVLVLLGLVAQDKSLKKLEWKLAPGHAAEFSYLDKAGKPVAGQTLTVFASEFTPTSNRIAVDACEKIPVFLLFQLPPEPIKASAGWEFQANFFNEFLDVNDVSNGTSLRPCCAKGRYLAKVQKKGDDEVATIEGAFSIVDLRRDVVNSQVKTTVTKIELGTLATTLQFSLSRGMILKAAWQFKMKGQDREGGRLVQKVIDSHQMLEFKEDVELDPAKIQPAIEASIARAVEWLKKQQKSGAWPSTLKGPASAVETVYLTAVAVRALAAAGVKPDDPALVAASKTLRSAPPQENFTLCQQILALAAKTPTKDEADDLRKFAEELQKRREPRSGGWAAVPGKNEFATAYLTAFALEAMAAAPDARITDETFKSGLEFFSGNWVEDDGRADLNIDFEKDATTIEAGPRKAVVPVTWPNFVIKGNEFLAGRKGNFFTHVAALRVLLLIPERLKFDAADLKKLDLPLSRGLSNLQIRWTLRTVPPIEGPWSAMRLEYLALLGSTLARAKVDRIAGSDWRLEGATLLLREQAEDGSWFAGTDQAVAKTAHALLFLAAAKR